MPSRLKTLKFCSSQLDNTQKGNKLKNTSTNTTQISSKMKLAEHLRRVNKFNVNNDVTGGTLNSVSSSPSVNCSNIVPTYSFIPC